MAVTSGRAPVASTAFQVFAKTIHPDWFTVRGHRRLTQESWEADVRIIEGGHVVLFRSGAVRLTEVLAGPEVVLPEPGLLFHSPIKHERSASLQPSGAVEYQTCFEVERVDTAVFAHLCDEMVLDAKGGRLFHRFAPSNRLAPAPISLIHVEARTSGLSVLAFHSFPDERAIVRTQSLFEPNRVRA
jgi:hypothetical protein